MVPYTYYRLCESYREADGKVKQRTVLGLGELMEFPKESDRRELAELLTSMINDGVCPLCDKPRLYDASLSFCGKWLEEKKEAWVRAGVSSARRSATRSRTVSTSSTRNSPAWDATTP